MFNIQSKEDKGYLLSLLTDLMLIIIAVYASIFYTPLIGALVVLSWWLLEYRRAKLRKQHSPLIVYPAMPFLYTTILTILGFVSFVFAAYYKPNDWSNYLAYILGFVVLFVWLYVFYRIYRYQRSKAQIKKLMKVKEVKPTKVVKKKVVKKKVVKKKVTKKKTSKKK